MLGEGLLGKGVNKQDLYRKSPGINIDFSALWKVCVDFQGKTLTTFYNSGQRNDFLTVLNLQLRRSLIQLASPGREPRAPRSDVATGSGRSHDRARASRDGLRLFLRSRNALPLEPAPPPPRPASSKLRDCNRTTASEASVSAIRVLPRWLWISP